MSNRQVPYSITKHSLVAESCYLRRGSRRGYNADIEEDNPRLSDHHHTDAAHVENDDDDDDDDDEGNTVANKNGIGNPTTNATTGNIKFYSHIKPKRRYRHRDDSTPRKQCPRGHQRQPFASSTKHKTRPHYWTMIHPDIDLSLVSLFSSRELDQRTTSTTTTTTTTPGGRGGGGGGAIAGFSTIPTTTTATCSSSSFSSSSSSDTTVNSRKKMDRTGRTLKDDDREVDFSSEDVITKARPLAVVDYGSIELDMSGSLLDSIYKIGPPITNTRTSTSGWGKEKEKKMNDGAILYTDRTMIGGGEGGRKRHGIPFAHTNYEPIRCKNRRISQRDGQAADTAPPPSNITRGSTNSISSIKVIDASCAAVQVHAKLSSRSSESNHPRFTITTTTTETPTTISKKEVAGLPPSAIISNTEMVHAGRRVCGPLPTISMVSTTLEAAISFSPYARVLFCAHPPYTVVHTNAAYVSLAQQRSLTKPCSVGGAFSNTCTKQREGESSETYVARMVMEHMQTLDPDHDDDDEEVSRARKPPRPGLFYYIYPVLSTEDPYSQFLHDFERRRQGMIKKTETSITTNNSAVLRDVEAAAETSSILASTSILHVPCAAELDGSLATKNESITSPIQYRTQYLLQIEPDGRYPY